ncbi:ARMADILLO BTB ARABIDOPSIS PROTEIN 1 (ABAP1) [Durusdinium trenchii]|uniref:ARMADILLO BTB ARABIDOPSIS PROTEIN 1 (ABAP1) n=1 Tax=Durusdinium trenchii TaxID=1381693 RepID=A0ABP0S2C1_9DINO
MRRSLLRAEPDSRPPWDGFRALRTAAFFGALPNPLSIFSPGGSTKIPPGETLWSSKNPKSLVWGPLDDVVMGGASESFLTGTKWKGTIVTEGGGFAGIRTQPIKPAFDVASCTGLKIRVKGGNGQRFKLIIRDSYDWNGIAWSYEFDTQSLVPSLDGLVEASAPFTEFVPTLFARRVPNQVFNKEQLTAIQLTLSKFGYDGALNPNFNAGNFELEAPPGSPPREKPEVKKRKKGVEGLAEKKKKKVTARSKARGLLLPSTSDDMDVVKILEPSVKDLSSKDVTKRGDAVERLAGLMDEHHLYPISLAKMNGIKPLIQLLGNNTATSAEKANASTALGHIAKGNAKLQEIVGASGLPALAKLLKSSKAIERNQATFALAHLANRNPRHQAALLKLGTLPHLVQQLSGSTDGDFGSAAYALATIAEGIEKHQTAIRLEGAIAPLVQHLASAIEGDRIDAAFCLARLAEDHAENQEAILDEFEEQNAVETLMFLLNSGTLAERINAMMTISRVTNDYEPAQSAFAEAGAIQALVEASLQKLSLDSLES